MRGPDIGGTGTYHAATPPCCGTLTAPTQGDRFIPKRSAMDGDMARYNLHSENLDPQTPGSASKRTPSKDSYKSTLAGTMLGNNKGPAKILHIQSEAPAPPAGHINSMRVLYSQNKVSDYKKKTTTRYIPQAPEKILDAPELMDDYYLNLLDWSSTNILAVALGQTVYLWNASTGDPPPLTPHPNGNTHPVHERCWQAAMSIRAPMRTAARTNAHARVREHASTLYPSAGACTPT